MAIVPYGALIQILTPVLPLYGVTKVCVCVQPCGKLIWLESNFFFSESVQSISVPLLGLLLRCASCCQGGSRRRWEQVVMNGEARIELLKQLRQCYHQM